MHEHFRELQRDALPSNCTHCNGVGAEPPGCPESGPCERCGGWTTHKRLVAGEASALRSQLAEARAFASRQRDRAVLAEAERDARAPEMAAAYQALREAIAERDARPNVTPKGARHLVSINYSPMCECDICETVRSGYRAHAAKARKR